MSDLPGVIVLIMLTGILVLGAVAFGCFIAHWYITRDVHQKYDERREEQDSPYSDFEEPEPEEEMPALKIDPSNPPTWRIYRGQSGPNCNCHERQIQYGENILMWPDPEERGAYRLFHEGFVKGMVPPGA